MTNFFPYCPRLVSKCRSAVLNANHQFAGVTKENRVPVSDSVYAWWRYVKGLSPSEAGTLFFAQASEQIERNPMASYQRAKDQRKTTGAPVAGRRVSVTFTDRDLDLINYYSARLRLSRAELIRGLVRMIPRISNEELVNIVIQTTEGKK